VLLIELSHARVFEQRTVNLKQIHIAEVISLDHLETVVGYQNIPANIGKENADADAPSAAAVSQYQSPGF
jgi:hypothetical protein